jgi:hypothetical protein
MANPTVAGSILTRDSVAVAGSAARSASVGLENATGKVGEVAG